MSAVGVGHPKALQTGCTPANLEFGIGIEVLDLKSLSIDAAAGDQAAFSTLVETHFGRMYTFARSLLGDEQEAEDAVQDSFVRAFQSIGRFDASRASFTTWMYTIVRNRCYSLLQARSKVPATADSNSDASHTSQGLSPVETAIEREQYRLLDRALAELPAEQRVAFVLCDIQGMTLQEASEIEEVPVGTIKSRRSRAAGKLRAVLQLTATESPDLSGAEKLE